jgi:hypothetical protein
MEINMSYEEFLQLSERDFWDYVEIIAPLILSLVAIIISLWSGIWSAQIKKLQAFLVWDEHTRCHHIIVSNSCRRPLVISTISLYASRRKLKEKYILGVRENAWATTQEDAYIRPGEAINHTPLYGSLFDVFAYKGHVFDVTEQMRDLPVYIKVTDLDNKTWRFRTNYSLGDLDDAVDFASKG